MATRAIQGQANAPAPIYFSESFQRRIAHWNHERLAPQFPEADWEDRLDRDARMLRLEGVFMEALRAEIADEAAAAPTDVDGFILWF